MIDDLFTDVLTIIPPSDTADLQGGVIRSTAASAASMQVPGRIEDVRHERGVRTLHTEVGDVSIITHRCFVPYALYNPDGSVKQLVTIPTDSHIRNQNNLDYLVVGGTPRKAIGRFGMITHLEIELQEIAGAI